MPSSSRRKSGKGGSSSRKRSSQASQVEPRNKKHKTSTAAAAAVAEEPELFKVKKIVGTKVLNGVTLYKTRWEGYTPDDDTWEPLEHVAGTGQVDRYERKQRELSLSTYTPGVAVIEYDDGERQTIDLLQEKFRSWMEISDDERDDDSVNGDDDVNNFDLIHGGVMIELLWPHAQIYFSCKVISWTPIECDDKKDKKGVTRHGSLVWKMKDDKKTESGEAESKSKTDAAPTTTSPSLADGAASGCKKCKRELETGEKSRREHVDHCPRKYNFASSKELDVKQKSVAVHKKQGSRNGGEKGVTKEKSNDAPSKKKSRPDGEKEGVESATKETSNDAPSKKKSRPDGEKEGMESATRDTSNDVPTKKKSRHDGEKERAESTTRDKSNDAPSKKKSRHDEKERAESTTRDKSNDAPIKKKSRPDGEKESAVTATSEVEEAKRNSDVSPTTSPSLADGAAAGCKKCKKELKTGEKSRKEHGAHCPRKYKFVGQKLLAVHNKKRSRPDGEKEGVESASPIKKKSRHDERERAETATRDKSNDDAIKEKIRPDGEKESVERATKDKSNDAPSKKKSKPNNEENTTLGDSKVSSKAQSADGSDAIAKTGARVREAKGGKEQKGGRVVNVNHYAKKPASYPAMPLRDVSKDVSDDDSGDAISNLFRTRNVSEDMTATLFGKAYKLDTSTGLTDIKERVADEMDIDALATAVAMKQSYPSVQTTTKSAAGKHDVDDSQIDNDKHDVDDSQTDNDGDKHPLKEKVGRGVSLYSDDDDYESSEDEGRGEREFFQPTAHPRDTPKLSFEEMWMMKLQRTQSIMDRNNGTRRW
jgi:hypothetical protein